MIYMRRYAQVLLVALFVAVFSSGYLLAQATATMTQKHYSLGYGGRLVGMFCTGLGVAAKSAALDG